MLQVLSDHCYFRQEEKETKTCLTDNLPVYGLNVIKDGPTIGSAVNVSLSLLPWIKVVGLELYITFTFLYCKSRIGEPRKKGKFAGHLSFVAKQPCGSVNQLQLRINIRKSPHCFMHTLLPKGIKLFFCAERFEIYFQQHQFLHTGLLKSSFFKKRT